MSEFEPFFNEINQRKLFFKIKKPLREHLQHYSRLADLPIKYSDLLRYRDSFPIMNASGKDTYWKSVMYDPSEQEYIRNGLKAIYQLLSSDGEELHYTRIENIDFCSYGNSQPFRIKVVNELNDNHDYFYMKQADASRIYGLELEDIFSPDKISYLVDNNTLVEEHIVGIPCDEFITKNKENKVENRVRLAKEFVKFNERCFTRLLGDMRAYNFVVEIQQDFDNIQYRLRAMDFDQQSYEGRKTIYLPQYYKDNISLVKLVQEVMSIETAGQYQRQERAAMKKRFLASKQRTRSLLRRMKYDTISTPEFVKQLREELSAHHHSDEFLTCDSMGSILILQLEKTLGITVF